MAYNSSPAQIEGRIDNQESRSCGPCAYNQNLSNSDGRPPSPPPAYNPEYPAHQHITPSHASVNVNVKVQIGRDVADNFNEPFINEQYEPGSKDYEDALHHIHHNEHREARDR